MVKGGACYSVEYVGGKYPLLLRRESTTEHTERVCLPDRTEKAMDDLGFRGTVRTKASRAIESYATPISP